MKIEGRHFTTIWLGQKKDCVYIIDQRFLPFRLKIECLHTVEDVCQAIADMHLRGAPLIGVAAAFGLYLALLKAKAHNLLAQLETAYQKLLATRPTAVNLKHALNTACQRISQEPNLIAKREAALAYAESLRQEEINSCRRLGEFGLKILQELAGKKKGQPLNILTHCNAGWLACVDYGTATAPIYLAYDSGIPIHVWVDETRPRNQGARLTAYELGQHGVDHTIIVDNAGGHLMQQGLVDVVIVGSDRTTARGDVCNKIGTYLKALAASENHIPFYVALPSSSIDFSIQSGLKEIPIEARAEDEVLFTEGLYRGRIIQACVTPRKSRAFNPGFDITPAHLITALITERGICEASSVGLKKLFPESFKD